MRAKNSSNSIKKSKYKIIKKKIKMKMKKTSSISIMRKSLLSVALRESRLKVMKKSSSWMMKETFMTCRATLLVILTWTMKMKKAKSNNTKMICLRMTNEQILPLDSYDY